MKTLLSIRTDPEVKKQAQKLNYTPTPYLEKILEKADKDIKAGRNLSPRFDNVDDMFEWLNNPKRKYAHRAS